MIIGTAFSLLGFSPVAYAVPHNVRFCAEYQVDFADSDLSLPANKSDDYLWSNSNLTAWGVQIQVVDLDTSDVYSQQADWAGSYAGCAIFNLDSNKHYEIRIRSRLEIDTTVVEIKAEDISQGLWYSVADDDFQPTATTTVNITTANAHRAWNVAAVLGWALTLHRNGAGGETIEALTDDTDLCPANSACAYVTQYVNRLYLGGATNNRYIIAHELGHVLNAIRDERSLPNNNYGYNGTCDEWGGGNSHEMASEEHAGAALTEGIANFYAAITFNDETEQNCAYMLHYSQDFDRVLPFEADLVGYPTPGSMSCEQSPIWDLFTVGAADYHGNFCGATALMATELDATRFFWDLASDHGVTFTQINGMWDQANPHNWNAVGNPGDPNDNAWLRLYNGASNVPSGSIATEVDTEGVYNGVAYH